jgi:hypothetical protein
MTSNKKLFGQFYTTNSDYILQGLTVPDSTSVMIEPFAGNGDLVEWANKQTNNTVAIQCFDIDPKVLYATTCDTLLNPPSYKSRFVITNPPYLARNKNKNKDIYNKWAVDDLYKAFIKTIVQGEVEGGIIIVPLNFLSDEDSKTRDKFFQSYSITKLNIFEMKVFKDTDYTVCSFQFTRNKQTMPIPTTIFPSKKTMDISLEEKYGWRIGGEVYQTEPSKIKISRLLQHQTPNTTLFLNAVDTGTTAGRIRLSCNKPHFYGKNTDRAFATIVSSVPIKDEQEVCDIFNSLLEDLRQKHHSLFLTNFRNSTKEYARKRISFDLAYTLIANILMKKNTPT